MDSLFLLQFACFIFMLINAFFVALSHLHVRWENKRYERSRWMIVVALIGLAIQYAVQMLFGFRAADDSLGAIVNILIYTPCFSLISMGIYNIETTSSKLRKMILMCSGIYAAIIVVFCVGISLHHSLYIREGLYLMLTLFCVSVFYCIYMIIQEMIRRKNMLETMAATDLLPYVRYSRASVIILWLAVLAMPVAIFSTTLLYIVGPAELLALLFFNLTFIALGSSYIPTEELLDKEENIQRCGGAKEEKPLQQLPEDRRNFIQNSLDQWCMDLGYKDCNVNMLTLSRTLCISKNELSLFFDQCLHSNFRIWLSEIRLNAAKKMMLEYPDYSNDIISAECGFSCRTHLYRIFKTKEDCSPTEWRDFHSTNAAQNDSN
ncbi:AraC family transcriptional regulator [Prevotellamassilia timonensis]|uniref:AraC family transcriptional regulator n=1 Tax=Prevotellamassilia timonensis TaxID=1852370 RepID=UPI0008D99568|nr:helix-turn-helix domain-containing protein [Prevotellamassilia timonensis]